MDDGSRLTAVVDCPKCSYRRIVPLSKAKNLSVLKCPQPGCEHEFEYRLKLGFDDRTYPDISPDGFTHPLDRSAIFALRKVPGVDLAIRKMMEYGYERMFRIRAMADAVKATPRTLSHIYDMAGQAAKCLGVPAPEVFVFQEPRPNAFTLGTEYPIVAVNSELVDLLDEDELYAAIAHEVGHIKCHHVLYLTLYNFLKNCLWFLGAFRTVMTPLNLALAEWKRKAELSSDRASMIVTNNKDSIVGLLMKIAAGSRNVSRMMDREDFLEQARRFENLTRDIGLNKFYRFSSYIWRSHPFTVLRASEINQWANSSEYGKILDGDYIRKEKRDEARPGPGKRRCPHCDRELEKEATFCDYCGHPAEKTANQYGQDGLDDFLNTMKSGYAKMREYFKGRNPETEIFEIEPRMCELCGELVYDPRVEHCPQCGGNLV